MDSHELAWDLINYWIKKDYASKADAIDELGDLDDLALNIMEVIESKDLKKSDGIEYISAMVDMELF